MDLAAEGDAPVPSREQMLETKARELAEGQRDLQTQQDAFKARVLIVETSFRERESALALREPPARQSEERRRSGDAVTAAIQAQNVDLREANAKLVMATLEAQELRDAAQGAHRRQEEFLAMLAHELRNPLAPISAAVDVLSKLEGKPVPERMLEIIRRQVRHMVRMVDDLLDVSRIVEGKVVLQLAPTAVIDLIQHAVETWRHTIDACRQQLFVEVDATLCVDGDHMRLGQVFSNLLHNATKYTPAGGKICVTACTWAGQVEIRMIDNGDGISPEALPHIFELFVQDARQLHRREGGLGIGLTLARRMVELHGGSIEAKSNGRGYGSEFIVRLPIAQSVAQSSVVEVAAAGPHAAKILIVEDNEDAATTLADLLRISEYEVEVAYDGTSGLQKFEALQPEIVVCDIGLPDIDGYEVVARIRQLRLERRPLLIALTGYGGKENEARALKAGFDLHLAKPVNSNEFLKIIDSAIRAENRER